MGKAIIKPYWMCIKLKEESFQKTMCVKARSSLSAAKKAWRCHKSLKEIWILAEDTGELYHYDTTHFLKLKKEHQLKQRGNKHK